MPFPDVQEMAFLFVLSNGELMARFVKFHTEVDFC